MIVKGSVQYRTWRRGSLVYHDWAWTSDSDGDVLVNMETEIAGIPYSLQTRPLEAAPTASYGVSLLDSDGRDILFGTGSGRSATATETEFIGDVSNVPARVAVAGLHQFIVVSAGDTTRGCVTLAVVEQVSSEQLPGM